MDRRRNLLAASMPSRGGTYDEYFGEIPPESTKFEFPLYITVPLSEIRDDIVYYKKRFDPIALQLFHWCIENSEIISEDFFAKTYKVEFNSLYINGVEMREAQVDVFTEEDIENTIWSIYPYDMQLGSKTIYEIGLDSDTISILLS